MKKGALLHRIYSIVLVLVSADHQMIGMLAELQILAVKGFIKILFSHGIHARQFISTKNEKLLNLNPLAK